MRLPRFLSKCTPGFEVTDLKEWLSKGFIEIYLKRTDSKRLCYRCGHQLNCAKVAEHKVKIRTMDIMGLKAFLILKRQKHYCPACKKTRSEDLNFVSKETAHLSKEYSWWLGRMCEISAVSRVGELVGIDQMTMWRLDFARLKRMLQHYKIPKVTKISVDEVYARKKKYGLKESRDKRFFTVICDLETRRVIWVSESREKAALDEFFKLIGPDRCKDIDVVAMDQHDSYKVSVEEHCPVATIVWDRFHIMQNFNQAVDEDRKWLHRYTTSGEIKRLTRGKFKRLFVKKSKNRSKKENRHINDVLKENQDFVYLELIKEGMHQLYDSKPYGSRKFNINSWSFSRWWYFRNRSF